MTTKIGINGFGRIGRNFFRAALAPGADLEPEPHAPEVPLERPDPPGRPVSSQVSMHADLVRYDVRAADGAGGVPWDDHARARVPVRAG